MKAKVPHLWATRHHHHRSACCLLGCLRWEPVRAFPSPCSGTGGQQQLPPVPVEVCLVSGGVWLQVVVLVHGVEREGVEL